MNGCTTRAEIADMIARTAALGAHHYAELLRPAMNGTINLILPLRETVMPPLHRMGKHRPLAVLVGDDDYAPAGPSTWACAAKLRSWAAFAIVHGSGAQAEHYAVAAEMTKQVRRLLMIETTSAAAQDWAAFLSQRADLPFMGVLPNDGPHPVSKGAVH